MHGDNQIVVRRKHEIFKFLNAAPVARLDEEGAARIGLSNFGNGAGVDRIHHGGLRVLMRLVVQLECQLVGKIPVMRGDLPPDGEEFFRASRRIVVEFVKMVNVDHHGQMTGQRVGDDKIHPRKNFRRQRKIRRRPGVMLPADWHAHMIKTFRAHDGNLLRRESHPPIPARRRFKIITKIDAMHEQPSCLIGGGIAVCQRLHFRRI